MIQPASFDLVILAAGMSSRFGGPKQAQPVGPAGELIIEYLAFDAMRAGFDRIVLVIRRDMENSFQASIGRRLEQQIDVAYVFQETSSGRAKPWGTGHAVLAVAYAVSRPFAVVNADDFHTASGYAALAAHFRATKTSSLPHYAFVGYLLRQTLSEHGSVSRGLCTTTADRRLEKITEVTKIEKTASGARYRDTQGTDQILTGSEIVSMNFWGLTPTVFPHLDRQFSEFQASIGLDPKAEFYLPTAISNLKTSGDVDVSLLQSDDTWFGLTYRQDLPAAQAAIQQLVQAGRYPAPLWE